VSAPATVLVHAGAGAWDRPRDRAEAACERAVAAGLSVLDDGGSAVDAAVAAVVVLEDDPACNAGTGAVPTTAGTYELDACVMDGHRRASGAVGCLTGWSNPVRVARSVLDDGRFHLLVGAGAAEFARAHGHPADGEERVAPDSPLQQADRGNTVGAVALDPSGRLAAATSTGGVPGQVPGRVGDTPIVGAGTFADGRAACSCTGDGESFARACAAYWAVERAGAASDVRAAADDALARTRDEWGGTGGLILLRADGSHAIAWTTAAMAHAAGSLGGPITVGR
jgi:beta-aspartyl-peptidase (threonine type)